MRNFILVLLLTSMPVATFAQSSKEKHTTVFKNGTLIDVNGGPSKTEMTVVVSGNRIITVGKSRTTKIPKGSKIVDATGKFLIPGLWDMHVHMFNNISRVGTDNHEVYFPLLIANGVTAARDMFSDPDDIKLAKQWQKQIEAGKLIGPRLFVSSSIVDGVPTFLPNLMGVKNAAEARAAVRSLKAAGAGLIKVYWNLTPETYFAIADESKKLGIPFAGHVPFLVSAAEVSNAGQKSIEHLTGILETCTSKEVELRNKEWTPAVYEEMVATFDDKKCLELYKRFAKNGTYHVPTAILHRGMALYDEPGFLDDPSFKYVPKSMMKEWSESPQLDRDHDLKTRKERYNWLLDMIGTMYRAGVPIMTGTDNNNPYVVPGFALHSELELFVRAGLTPIQALQSATIVPARYLGLTRSNGSTEKGKIADIILLDADPLSDIRNTRKIAAVMVNGKLLDRADLDKMLKTVEASATNN
ncbi:MAG TPA: amidohydrolase family protein [Pyrinomonadaceae bacterium]|nr:amidohydrolase family protein [Acidobacteriota bacterium]HQZ97498.1 amidohydrolase family protein [Pyrinomonadaceae bacterium]